VSGYRLNLATTSFSEILSDLLFTRHSIMWRYKTNQIRLINAGTHHSLVMKELILKYIKLVDLPLHMPPFRL
jgi:hypothetical protein